MRYPLRTEIQGYECADWMIESSMTNDELAKLLDTQIWVIEAIRARNILPSHKIQKTLCGFLGKAATRRYYDIS